MTTAVYPGTFDPPTKGHLDIALRAASLFDTLIVAVYDAPPKTLLFTTEERVQLWREALPEVPNVTVEAYTGLTVELARQKQARAVVRGLRAVSDFEYELEMALMNRKLDPDVEEIFLMTSAEYVFTSSSRLKEVYGLGRSVPDLVPANVDKALQKKFRTPGS